MNKKYKKTAAVFTAAILMTANLTACSLKKNKNSDLKDFSIGYLPSTGHLLYFVAK